MSINAYGEQSYRDGEHRNNVSRRQKTYGHQRKQHYPFTYRNIYPLETLSLLIRSSSIGIIKIHKTKIFVVVVVLQIKSNKSLRSIQVQYLISIHETKLHLLNIFVFVWFILFNFTWTSFMIYTPGQPFRLMRMHVRHTEIGTEFPYLDVEWRRRILCVNLTKIIN